MKFSRSVLLLFAAAAILLAGVGLTYAWFFHNTGLATLMEILPPDTISIIPISTDGSAMTELDLDFREGTDKKDEDGTIHIVRPICIKSTSPIHRLEVVHTTNLKNMKFRIYPAVKSSNENAEVVFLYDETIFLSGQYINNEQNIQEFLAKQETLENYQSTTDVADAHAYPLYWLAENCVTEGHTNHGGQSVTSETQPGFDPVTKTEKTFYYTYYYLEISWLEETKETDLFYIMAQNVAE